MRYVVLTFFLIVCVGTLNLLGQVGMLAKGNWVKIAVPNEGVFQCTGAQLKSMGFTGKLNANQVQLFGMDLSKLTEKVPAGLPDSLTEIAIEMQDGGDGFFDDQDRFLFYAQGKIKWVGSDGLEAPIRQKIVNNDSLYFFIRIGEKGKRINSYASENSASKLVQQYPEKWLIEKDTINVLSSGKVWLGEPMGIGNGKKSTLQFAFNMEGLQWNAPVTIQSQLAATTFLTNANFSIKLNDFSFNTSSLNTVNGSILDDAYTIKFDSVSKWLEAGKLIKTGQTLANVTLQVDFSGPATATGWVDYIALHGQRKIGYWGTNSFGFEYSAKNVLNQTVEFEIQNASSETKVWELSQYAVPSSMKVVLGQNSVASFKIKDSAYKYFYVFESNKVPAANMVGKLEQDSSFDTMPVDYIIIAAPDYLPAAKQLKAFHEKQNGFKVGLVKSTQVFNEMASGQTDPIAIRNYIKYIVAQSTLKGQPKPTYLLLFGIGNFNAQKIQLNKELPVFTSEVSNSILSSYSTDDFYAIQQPGAHIRFPQTIESIDLAVGRIPARNSAEATMMVQKLLAYQGNKKMGLWQNQLTWVADDADYNLHLQDAEEIINNINSKTNHWNHRKIYLDLFKANQSLTGATYPEVNKAIQEAISGGSLMLNYTGHGNYLRLSEEAVISKTTMDQWNNTNRLPVMVAASCDFAPYDQTGLAPIGFDALMQNEKGIIALVAANRLVFAFSNKQINDAFMQALLVPNGSGKFAPIGQALQAAKKYNFSKNGDRLNAFKFGLMGDPAMQILQPTYQIQCVAINDVKWTDSIQLKAGGKYTLKGQLTNNNQKLQNFNGFVDMLLWDAPSFKKTLANQMNSQAVLVETQEQAIFKGKATVQNGQFEISFILPFALPSSDVKALKLQLYAYNDTVDAMSRNQSIFIQGNAAQVVVDTVGPKIKSYINAPYFKSGDWVNFPATLIVELEDSAGIQSSGNELGHDLRLIVDDTITQSFNLNPFFTYNLNQFQSGTIQYALPILSSGKHRFIIKAWDLLGNISKDTIWIDVPDSKNKNLRNLQVFPNPVQNAAKFSFEIKNVKDPILMTIQVFDASGKLHFNQQEQVQPSGNRIVYDWDGRSQSEGLLPPGQYYYRVLVRQNGVQEQLLSTLLKY